MHQEYQYLRFIQRILRHGELRDSRNGKTLYVFGNQMRFSLRKQTLPLLTSKFVPFKTCLHELLWFLKGQTSNSILQKKGVHIWNDNASRSFLDSRKLYHYKVNDLGPIYGHQWRYFNAPYQTCDMDYTNKGGIDQIQSVINILQGKHPLENKYSRRLIVSAWNPCQLDQMALPPCHVLFQFHVNSRNELSCSLYQRSGDVGLGIPFNIASYSILTLLIAHHCGLKPGEFIHTIGDAHIYHSHIPVLRNQLKNVPYLFPKLHIKGKHKSIDSYYAKDFKLLRYQHHGKLKMKMVP